MAHTHFAGMMCMMICDYIPNKQELEQRGVQRSANVQEIADGRDHTNANGFGRGIGTHGKGWEHDFVEKYKT